MVFLSLCYLMLPSEPCQPVNVSARAFCQSEEVQISWHQASGVVKYLVTANGSLGYVEIHNTTQTNLTTALPCGQHYNVTVQGRGSKCDSIPSSPAFFKTSRILFLQHTTCVTHLCIFELTTFLSPQVHVSPTM